MAVNLLPESERKALKFEYYLRFSVVALLFLCFGILAGVTFLLPSYVLSSTKVASLEEKAALLERSSKETLLADVEQKLNQMKYQLAVLGKRGGEIAPSVFVKALVDSKPSGIRLDRISIVGDPSGSVFVTVSGIAQNRETLLSLHRALENNPVFAKADLPLSDLAKSQSILFTMRLEATSAQL